jgi:hypothetical protein
VSAGALLSVQANDIKAKTKKAICSRRIMPMKARVLTAGANLRRTVLGQDEL